MRDIYDQPPDSRIYGRSSMIDELSGEKRGKHVTARLAPRIRMKLVITQLPPFVTLGSWLPNLWRAITKVLDRLSRRAKSER